MKWIDNKLTVYDRWMLESTKHADICDAITCAAEMEMDMEEKKARGVSFNKLEKTLREMGIFLTEIRQDSWGDYTEIVASIDWLNCSAFLEKKNKPKYWDLPAMKKDARPHPKKVIFSGPATTILWMDGTKTTVKCQEDDVFNEYTGILACYAKKMLGNEGNFNNIFREAMKVAVVVEPKVATASTINSDTYISSAFDSMSDISMSDINKINDKINKRMKDAADALSKVAKEKK